MTCVLRNFMTGILVVSAGLASLNQSAFAATENCVARALEKLALDQWIESMDPAMHSQLDSHFQPGGAVFAADPTINADYRMNWRRDSALAYLAGIDTEIAPLVVEFQKSADPTRRDAIRKQVLAFIDPRLQYHRKTQDSAARLGLNPGEPRFDANGDVPLDQNGQPVPWGRPQTGGAGLSAIEETREAWILLTLGEESRVRTELFDNQFPAAQGTLKRDLEFISHPEGMSHDKKTFDAWEEQVGNHFDTAVVQIRALRDGARLVLELAERDKRAGNATQAGDLHKTAAFYLSAASRIQGALDRHWNSKGQYYLSSIDVDSHTHPEKTEQLDSIFLLAIAQGYGDTGDPVFRATDPKVLATIRALEIRARQRYPGSTDPDGITPLMRYFQDFWKGQELPAGDPNRMTAGTYAWIVPMEAAATDYFLARNEYLEAGQIAVTSENLPFLQDLLGSAKELRVGAVLKSKGRSATPFSEVVSALDRKGDAYLRFVQRVYAANGDSSEGFDPVTLQAKGPKNLAWNYVEWFRAVQARARRPSGQ
jgi:glucoamylase